LTSKAPKVDLNMQSVEIL